MGIIKIGLSTKEKIKLRQKSIRELQEREKLRKLSAEEKQLKRQERITKEKLKLARQERRKEKIANIKSKLKAFKDKDVSFLPKYRRKQ